MDTPRERAAMRWFYYEVRDGALRLATDDELGERPAGAQEAQGNPHTPWYKSVEHYDANHIHIRAETEDAARQKAERILATYSRRPRKPGWLETLEGV